MLGITGDVQAFESNGPHAISQDVQVHGRNRYNGAYILGVTDGHGDDGISIAQSAALCFTDAIATDYPEHTTAMGIAKDIGVQLGRLTLQIEDDTLMNLDYEFSGAAALVAVVHMGKVALAYLGHARAYFLPDEFLTVPLNVPHNRSNDAEIERAYGKGGRLIEPTAGMYWTSDIAAGNKITITGAVGDTGYGFVKNYPDYSEDSLPLPGQLLVATNGFVGRALAPDVESAIRKGRVSQEYVDQIAIRRNDSSAVLIATIG